MDTVKQVAIYPRISHDPQDKGDKVKFGERVKRQQAACREVVTHRADWVLFDVYCDNNISAFSGRVRTEYQRMLSDIKRGVIDVVVAWDVDRLHRNDREMLDFMDLVNETGIEVFTVTGGKRDFTSVNGRIMAKVESAFNVGESEHKGERVRAARAQEAAQGRLHCGGKYKWGIAVSGRDPEVVRAERKAIQFAAKRVLAGASMRSITRDLTEQGVTTPYGKAIDQGSLRRVLLSPYVAGLRGYHGEIVSTVTDMKPIITEDVWRKVGAILTDPARTTNGGSNARSHLLSGFLTCGLCRATLASAKINDHAGWRCKKCYKLTVKSAPIEDHVRDMVLLRISSSHLPSPEHEDDSETMTELRALRARRDAIETAHFVEGQLTKARYRTMSAELDKRISRIEKEVATTSHSTTLLGLPTTEDALRTLWDRKDMEWRRALIAAVIESVLVLPSSVRGAPFDASRVKLRFHR